MKFMILAVFVAASSAAQLRSSAEFSNGPQAWYNPFEGKKECITAALDSSKEKLGSRSNRLMEALRQHEALDEIAEEAELILSRFDQLFERFANISDDSNIMTYTMKIAECIPEITDLSLSTMKLTAKAQILPVRMMDKEGAETVIKALEPFGEFVVTVKDFAADLMKCMS